MGLQVGLQASARAAARARPQELGARAAGAGAELELGPGAGSEAGPGSGEVAEPGDSARSREEAELEAGVRAAWVRARPDARVVAAPLGLVPRPDPDLRRLGLGSRFLQ